MITRFLVTPHSTVNQIFVLRRMGERKLVERDEYADLVCTRCRKVDEQAALDRGVRPMTIRSKRPFVLSSDFFYLVNDKSEQLLRSIAPDLINFTPIPTTTYFIASPKTCIQPIETDPGFRFVDVRCAVCNRPREVVWGNVPPTLGNLSQVVSVNIEGQLGARSVWLVSEDIARELKRHSSQLTGMVIRPKEVA